MSIDWTEYIFLAHVHNAPICLTKSVSTENQMSIGLTLWIAFSLLICLWLVKVFYRGRYQFQRNLHVIEDGLKKMQEEMELRRRQKSIGCIENIEDITALLDDLAENKKEETQQTVEQVNENAEGASSSCEKEEIQDKKNI